MTFHAPTAPGAVAAGHDESARAGAEVLDAGGNAVDAVVAMLGAGAVTEGTLSTLGGGGFMLVAEPDGTSTMLDFFVRQPGFSPRPFIAPWSVWKLELDGTVLSFGTGPASVAVPGLPAGLAHASSRFGRLPFDAALAPAMRLAQDGVRLTHTQAIEHHMNHGMLSRDPDGQRIYTAPDGGTYREGALFRQPMLAAALEELAATGGRSFYEGAIADALVRWSDERGGRFGREDLARYQVHEREPLTLVVGDVHVSTNPPPAMGGRIICELLLALVEGHSEPAAGNAESARVLARVLRELRPPLTRPPVDGDEVEHQELPEELSEAVSRYVTDTPGALSRSPNTTHVAAVDSDGMFASATATVGYGSGEFIPGTGIQLNNILAEYDHTARRPAGVPVPSMMSPSVLRSPRTSVAIGSAGSDRIPQAIAQILARMWGGASLNEAILAPRFVFDGAQLHCEPGFDDATLDAVGKEFDVVEWHDPNAYFGTSNGVAVRGGQAFAQGDTRREGAGIVLA